MNTSNILLAAPEIWVMLMACTILLADLFLREERQGIIHLLAMVTLIFAAIITLRADYLHNGLRSAIAFNGSFLRDPMGDVFKLFSYVVLAFVFIYAKFYLRQFRMFRADFYTLSLFALLGVMLLISANNLVMIYLGLEMTSLSTYALVAYDRDSTRGSEAAMKYFVLGSMASGMLLYGMSMIFGATGSLDLNTIRCQRCGTRRFDTDFRTCFPCRRPGFQTGRGAISHVDSGCLSWRAGGYYAVHRFSSENGGGRDDVPPAANRNG